jgi:carboxypeptidase family protein/fibronectin type III domain protein
MRRLPLLVLAAALACTTEVAPQNPYDPATPPPLQAKARVTGSVQTGAGAPLAQLDVYLRQNGQLLRSFTTDAAGAFVFDALTPGSYAVEAQAPGFAPVSVPLALAPGAEIDVGALRMTPLGGVDSGFLRGTARLGKVAAVPGGPVEEDPAADNGGILIEAVDTPYAAVTTSSGDYELALPPGRHALRVSHPNYVAQTLTDLQVDLGVVSGVVVVVLATNPAKVTGQVLGELPQGGTGPLAFATVTLEGTSATGITNAAGQFTLDQLAPGSYLLRVLVDGYQTTSVPVLNLTGGEERLLTDPLTLSLQRGSLRGRVALADAPADASGVVVEVTGSGRAVVTGADGSFAFDALVAGTYEVRARREGYAQQAVGGLAVTAGANVDVPLLTLTRQGGTVAISEGAVTRSRPVTLLLGAPSAASWRASEDPTFQDAALGDTTATRRPYAGAGSTGTFTLSDRDGEHVVYVVFHDASDGASAPASAAVVLDRVAPAAPSVVIEGDAPFTRSATVGLRLSAQDLPATAGAAVSGLARMELAENSAFTGAVLLDFNLAHTWTLTGLDGTKAVYARFYDRAGNQSATAVDLVTLDRLEPEAPSLTLSGGPGVPAGTTGSPLVTAALSATDANEGTGKQDLQVRLSNASGFAGASWQPYAASVSWLLPPGDGQKTVYAQFMDPAGNQSLPVEASITLAGTAPSDGRITLAGGAAATSQQVVPVEIFATGATLMRLSVNGVPQPAGWIPYAASATVDLGAVPDEATRTVSVAFRNSGGLEGGGASAAILLDQRAPTAGSLAIDGGAAYAGSLAVTLSLAALDAPQAAGGVAAGLDTVELSNDAFATSTTVPMVASLSWALAAGADGPRTVSARFRDRAGNVSSPATTATIVVDTTRPAGAAITLAGSAAAQAGYTGTPVVTAALAVTDANDGGGAKPNLQMRLSSDPGFAGASWQPFAAAISFALPGADGPKTVWAQFRDAAGNESLATSASIQLAVTPPSAGSITVPAATSQQTVTATLAASGADRMLVSVNGLPQPAGWIPYATTVTVDLGANPDEATRAVSVLFRNAGGVEGAAAATSTVVDRTPPTITAGSVAVDGGAAFTGALAVTVTLAASDGPALGTAASGLATVELSNDGATFASLPYAASVAWTLPDVADGPRTVTVRVRDRAGNLSGVVTDAVVLDRTGPSGATISLAGNATAKAGYTGTPVVTATVSATDPSEGAGKADLQVRLGNDQYFSGSNWQPYATSLSWLLPVGDGAKQVWVQFKDGVGNLSTPTSATVNLMETPPSVGTIAVAGGAAVTNQSTVTATLSAVNADRMQIYVNGQAQPAGWVAYGTAATVDLGAAPDESTRTVSVVFRNAGGVDGGDALASLVLDQTPPVVTAASVLVAGGASWTGDPAVTLALSASDGPVTGSVASGLATVELSNDGFATSQSFPYATSLPWTLLGGGDGARTVSARFRDKAGNLSAPASDAIGLDRTGPSGATISLAGNAAARAGYTGTPVVTATVGATDPTEGAGKANLQVRLGNDFLFSGSNWQPYATSLSWVLPVGDGAKQVWVQFKDAVGNLSTPTSATITLAEAPPSAGTIAVAGGAAATSLASVTATLSAASADRMLIYVNGLPQAAGWIDYGTTATVDLGTTPDESTRTVSVVYRNAGGVDGGDALTSIVYDRTAPASTSVLVGGGATWTGSRAVTLALSASDGPATGSVASGLATVELSNDGFTTSQILPYATSLPWNLAAGGSDGARTVSARFRDKAGNLSATPQASDAIILDTAGPTSPLITLAGNAEAAPGYTGTPVVTATVSATDVNEGAAKANLQVRLGHDATFAGSNWQPYATSLSWVLTAGDGSKNVYVQFRDASGNLSATPFASISLLTTPPSGGSIVLAGGAAATSAPSVGAAISATGAATMRLSVNGAPVTGWIAYATSTTVSLASVPDQTTAVVSVSFRNQGGIEGGAATAAIRSDRTAPGAGALAVTGTLGNGSTNNALTSTPAVTLAISPPGLDETEMAVAQAASAITACSASFGTPLWQPVSRSVSLVLTGADGAKRACVLFRDAAGNFTTASAATADITLDTTAPTNPAFVNLVSATQKATTAPTSGTPVITASSDATSGGVTYQCTGGTGAHYGASWVDCGGATTLPFAYELSPNAQSTLGVRARDAAYNYSPGSFVQIVHDGVAPMPPNVTGVQTTRDSLSITWEASPDVDVASYRVYYGNFAGDFSGTGAAQGPSPVTVTATGQATQGFALTGLTTSYPYYVAVEAVDRAGNLSGPSGQRFAQPNDANPRLLSTYGGQQRSVGVRSSAASGRTYAYVMQNQAVVQLDVTVENQLPSVTGRASLPNFVPDPGAPVVVFDCSRTNRAGTVVAGHCVVTAGVTLEGDFRGDWDAYRAPAPVVFFPSAVGGGGGTVMTVLPARPHRVVLATVGGKQVLLTVERSGVKAFDMAVVKAPRMLASAALDLQTVSVAGEAWGTTGQALLVYAPVRTGTLPNYPPNLYELSLSGVWSGTLAKVDHGWLEDPAGNLMGWSVTPIVPIIGDMQLYIAWKDVSGTWIGEWSPGSPGPWDWLNLTAVSGVDNQPIAGVAGNMHVYVFADQPPAMSDPPSGPYAYQLYSDGGLTVTGELSDLATGAQSAALGVYTATGTSDDEHLFAVDRDYSGAYTVQRWRVSSATNAATYNANAFREVSPTWFAESDRFVFISESDKIFALDVANPLNPQVVATYDDLADTPAFGKLQVHGRYLYAMNTGGNYGTGVYVFRMGGGGTLARVGHLDIPMGYTLGDFVVRGRYAYLALGWIRVFDVANPASPSQVAATASNVGCATLDARPLRVGATNYEAVVYCGVTGDYSNPDRFQTYTYTAPATLTALSAAIPLPNDNGYWHPKSVTVRGSTAVVGNTIGSHVIDVANPASPTVGTSVLPVSGPVLFQGGYVVGLGMAGAASGPDFLRQLSGAQDGTLLFSTCGVDGSGLGSLASANGVYYASCQRNGVSVFAAAAPGGGSLLLRADVSLAWNGLTRALATDGAATYLAGPEYPAELGRLYSVDGRSNPTGSPAAPSYFTGNRLPGSDAAFHFLSQDGVLQVFEGFYNNSSLSIRTMLPTPADAVWPTRGTYTVPIIVGQSNGPWNCQPASDGEFAWVSRKIYLERYDLRSAAPAFLSQQSVGVAMGALALARDRLYAGVATSGQVQIYDTSAGGYGAATWLNVTATSGSVTGITGLAAHGSYLFVTLATNGVDPYGLAVYKLGAGRDGNGASRLAYFASQVPLGNPTVAGDVLYVTRDLGLATYDLTPLWQDAVPPVLAGATVSTEPAGGVPRFVIDGPWGYLVGGTFRTFDLRQ